MEYRGYDITNCNFTISSSFSRGNQKFQGTYSEYRTYREDQMHKHVEGNERNQNEIQPIWQLCLLQFNGKKYGNDCDDMGQISNQPVEPVEQRPPFGARVWSEVGANRLQKAKHCGYHSQDAMRIIHLRPASNFHKDDNKTSHSQNPGQYHQKSVPLEILNA